MEKFGDLTTFLNELGIKAADEQFVVSSTAQGFAENTALALQAQRDILTIPLDDFDPHYKAKLAAKTSVSSAQITAQLKSDETALKVLSTASFYDDLKAVVAAVRARKLDE